MTTTIPTITGGLLVRGATKAEDLTVGMFWNVDAGSWPHRIATVKVLRANVRITDEYGTEKTFRKGQNVGTSVIIGDMPA
jgi:hypothetical protein